MRGLITLLALAFSSASLALPDLERGIRYYKDGRYEAAEADLAPLAEKGYVEAAHYLARLYYRREGEGDAERALRWFGESVDRYPLDIAELARLRFARDGDLAIIREAADRLQLMAPRHRDEAWAKLLKLARDFPQAFDADATNRLIARALEHGGEKNLRAVIGLYKSYRHVPANRKALVELCEAHRAVEPNCYTELVREARRRDAPEAVDTYLGEARRAFDRGRIDADELDDIASALIDDDIGTAPMSQRAADLLAKAQAGSRRARARLGALLLDEPNLETEHEAIALLESALKAGSPDAGLELGRAYLNGDQVDVDPDRALELLEQAAQVLPAGTYSLAKYHLRGYSGHRGPLQAAELLLKAARNGYARADLDLARLFTDRVGVADDPVKAYAFALIASRNGVRGAEERLAELDAAMDRGDVNRAKTMARKEWTARRRVLPADPQLAMNGPHREIFQ